MIIHGFQKLTLLDYPWHTACTVFSGGCNFRCPFCHNAGLVLDPGQYDTVDEEDILSLLKKRRGILDGVCITGGEPLLNPDIEGFAAKVKGLGYRLKLDTNGSFPERLRHMVSEGLVDYVAMDIKNCLPKYPMTVGKSGFDTSAVEKSVEFLRDGRVDFEFRTTVVREFHTEDDMREIGKWLAGVPKYFLQAFSDSGELIGDGLHGYSPEEYKRLLSVVREYIPTSELRGV